MLEPLAIALSFGSCEFGCGCGRDPRPARLVNQAELFELRGHLGLVNRLGHVGIAVVAVGIADVLEVTQRRGHHNFRGLRSRQPRTLFVGTYRPQRLLTVDLGHHDVEADQVIGLVLFERQPDRLDRFLAIDRDMARTVLLQEFLHDRAAYEIIFDDQSLHRVLCSGCAMGGMTVV